MAKSKSNKKLNSTIIIIIIALVAIVSTVLLVAKGSVPKTTDATYKDPKTGLTISYSSDLKLVPYDPPKQDSVLFNLTKSDPKILITASYEQGDAIAGFNLSDGGLNKALIDDKQSQLEEIYNEVKVIDTRLSKINGYDSGEIIFTHVSANLPTTQRLVVVIKDGSTAISLACQSLTDQYEQINADYFDPLIGSVSFE